MSFPILTAEEAASYIKNLDTIGTSGFTAPGAPKAIIEKVAEKAIREHEAGRPFKINIMSGASTNPHLDGALANADACNFRAPYQNTPDMRKRINAHDTHYCDRHLSELAQDTRYGFFGKIDYAIIEVCDIKDDGEVVLTTGVGNTPTWARLADKIFIEFNHAQPKGLKGMHDLYVPLDPPYRREIPIYKASDRCGSTTLKLDPKKIIGIVNTDMMDGVKPFTAPDETSNHIGANVVGFLENEVKAGRIPSCFLPVQSGVGNVANAVLEGLATSTVIPSFEMYTEVVQNSVIDLIQRGRCRFASTCSLTISDDKMHEVFDNMDFFHDKFVLRPSEISNNPEVARRIGVIAMNTALEADIFGAVNSSHVLGTKMMNGIGGSGDFTRAAYLSIFSCPSITKGGIISNIVPLVAHVDHSEHSVDVVITEQGVADLRHLDPLQRAHAIIDNCAHPMYRPLLRDYLKLSKGGNTPQALQAAFAFHVAFNETGDMRNVDFSRFA